MPIIVATAIVSVISRVIFIVVVVIANIITDLLQMQLHSSSAYSAASSY